jgi:hypothetical protein
MKEKIITKTVIEETIIRHDGERFGILHKEPIQKAHILILNSKEAYEVMKFIKENNDYEEERGE